MALVAVAAPRTDPDQLRIRFARVIADLHTLPTAADALALSGEFQNRLLAFDASVLASEVAAGAGDRQLEELSGRGTTCTKREAHTRANRAKAIAANPALGDDLASGTLTRAGLDAIATVAESSDGVAATDRLLIERVKTAPPDQAKVITRQWLDDHTSPADHETRYQHQRRLRNVTKYPTRRGLMAICAEGDRESIDQIWAILTTESKRLHRADGGRDLPPDQHPRTRHQRRFDALHTLTTTGGPTADSDSHSRPGTSTDTGNTSSSTGARQPNRKVQVYVTLTLQELLDGATRARLVGGGTIPTSLLAHHLTGDAAVAGVLFNGDGHVLWHGRNQRWATHPQLSALIARDHGCVLCAAHPTNCDSHHLTPYNAPAQGNTNTDELALVCTDCHHHIHTNNLTLTYQPNPHTPGKLTWKLRPATPDELPP